MRTATAAWSRRTGAVEVEVGDRVAEEAEGVGEAVAGGGGGGRGGGGGGGGGGGRWRRAAARADGHGDGDARDRHGRGDRRTHLQPERRGSLRGRRDSHADARGRRIRGGSGRG